MPFLMFHATLLIWSATLDAMKLASEEMFIVKPPKLALVVIQGGRAAK